MDSNLILTTAQAQAVYSAMCALNSVHMRACDLRFGSAIVTSDFNGVVRVLGKVEQDDERYADQAAFAAAYDLRDAPDVTALLNEAESAARRIDWFLDMNPDHVDSTLNVIRQDLRKAIAGGHR